MTSEFIKDGRSYKVRRGYICVKVGSIWIAEHRLVIEEKIKRPLTSKETVHHLDEVKTNNRIENLMLFPTQRAHASFHTKIRQFGFTSTIKRQIKNRWDEY